MTILLHEYIRFREDNYRWHREGHIWEGRECANGTYGHIGISANGIVRAACWWDSGCADGPYGLLAGSIVMRRYYCIGSLDSGRQTGDGVVRAAFW